jgi:hypothetical protein
MKIGKNKLKMSSGEIRSFRSEQARNNFERVAQAYKHRWRSAGKPNRIRVIGKRGN